MNSATRKKDLRAGRSVWMSYPTQKLPLTPLEDGKKVDVVVIGAGITGAMIAEELSEAGFSVAILDKRGPILGSTQISTALVQYEIDLPFIRLAEKIGQAKAMQAWRRSKLAVDSLASKLRELDIRCDAVRRDSLYLSGNILDAEELQEEHKARAFIGLRSHYLDRKQLKARFGINHPAALLSHDNLSVNPRRMAAGFLAAALERGASLHAPQEVRDVVPHAEGAHVTTAEGLGLQAKHVIFAGGYEIPRYITSRKYRVVSTWAMATRPQPENLWRDEVFLWEAADPYMYIRTTVDGRVICGGEDANLHDEQTRNALTPEKVANLQKKLATLFPRLDTEAEFAWTGCFGLTSTGLPSIGRIPGMANTYAVLAFGGNGMTFSRIAAEIFRARLTGKTDPDSSLFAFSK